MPPPPTKLGTTWRTAPPPIVALDDGRRLALCNGAESLVRPALKLSVPRADQRQLYQVEYRLRLQNLLRRGLLDGVLFAGLVGFIIGLVVTDNY